MDIPSSLYRTRRKNPLVTKGLRGLYTYVFWKIVKFIGPYKVTVDVQNCDFTLFNKVRKDQESIQSSSTPDPGYQWESGNFTIRHHK